MKHLPKTTAALRRLRNNLAEAALIKGQELVLATKREPDPFRRSLMIWRASAWNAVRQFIRPAGPFFTTGGTIG